MKYFQLSEEQYFEIHTAAIDLYKSIYAFKEYFIQKYQNIIDTTDFENDIETLYKKLSNITDKL